MLNTGQVMASELDKQLVITQYTGLDYDCERMTKKTDTNTSCNTISDKNTEDSWTFVEEKPDDDNTKDLIENLNYNERLLDTLSLGFTVNNVKEAEMEENCKTLKTKSLEFFEGSKYERDCEWTSASYFASENTDGLLPQDKDVNGNYHYLEITNTNDASNAVICEHFTSSLNKLKHEKLDGNAVLEPQGGLGTRDHFDEILSKICQIKSDDNCIKSGDVDIEQGPHDVRGYVNCRESYPISSLCQELLDRKVINTVGSHEIHWTRNAPQDLEIPTNNRDDNSDNFGTYFDKELQSVKKGVALHQKESVDSCFETKNSRPCHGGLLHVGCRTVVSQADKCCVQEDEIVPVTMRREPVCLTWFDENITPVDHHRRSCVSPEECELFNDNEMESDDIVVIAVCDDGNDYRLDDDDDTVKVSMNREEDDEDVITGDNIRLTAWHAEDCCHGDDAAKWSPLNYNTNNDSCHGNVVKSLVMRNSASDSEEHNDDDSCHGNDSTELEVKNSANYAENRDDNKCDDDDCDGGGGGADDDDDNEYCDDDDNEINRMTVNGGNPFELDESEFQKLIQLLDNSSDSIDDYSDDQNIRTQRHGELDLQLISESTENATYEQNNVNTCHDDFGINESQGPIKSPFGDDDDAYNDDDDNDVADGNNDDADVDDYNAANDNDTADDDVDVADDNATLAAADDDVADDNATLAAADDDVADDDATLGADDDVDVATADDIDDADDNATADNDDATDDDNDENYDNADDDDDENYDNAAADDDCEFRDEENGSTSLEIKTDAGELEKTDSGRTPTQTESLHIESEKSLNKEVTTENKEIEKPLIKEENIEVDKSKGHIQDQYELNKYEVNLPVESNTKPSLDSGVNVEVVNDCESALLVKSNTNLLHDGVNVEVVNKAVLQEDCQHVVNDCGSALLVKYNSNSLHDGANVEVVNKALLQEDCQHVACGSSLLVGSNTTSLDAQVKERVIKYVAVQDDCQDHQEFSEFNNPVVMIEPNMDSQQDKAEHNNGKPLGSQLEPRDGLEPESTENVPRVQPSSERRLSAESVNSKNTGSQQERIENVNKAFEWVRNELQDMRALDFNLKVQFDGLRQEVRTLREEYELYINCEYYDDDEIFDEATEYLTNEKGSSDLGKDLTDQSHSCKLPLKNGLREDSGYHSDTPSPSSTETRSSDNDEHATHAHAKYYYQPLPTYPKIQELNSDNCVFELVL